MRFSIRSLFAITAAYAVVLAVMRPVGTAAIVAAIVSGTALSGAIVLGRRKDIGPIFRVAFGTIMGGFLGVILAGAGASTDLLSDYVSGRQARREIASGVIGAMCGAVLASVITHSQAALKDAAHEHDRSVELARRRKFRAILRVPLGMIMGWILGGNILERVNLSHPFVQAILPRQDILDYGFTATEKSRFVGGVIGGVIGATCVAVLAALKTHSNAASKDDADEPDQRAHVM